MMLDEKYPELVKSTNVLNLKPRGPSCFDTMKRNRETAKRHQFLGKYPLEKHEKFGPVTENIVTDDKGTNSDMELIESEQAEVPVRELPLTNSENLAALIELLKDSLGNPPPVITPIKEEQAKDDVTEDIDFVVSKRQRVETESSIAEQVNPNAETEPIIQAEPKVAATAQDNVIPDFFEILFPKTTTSSEQESSSGVRFEVGGSLSGGMSEQEEHLLRAAEKMKVFEDSDSDDDVDVVKLQKKVVVLEQDSILKDAHVASLQAQVSNKGKVIDELQSGEHVDVDGINLKAKLEKKFGSEFADKHDDPMNVAQRERERERERENN
ncbi:hypothetical protein Hanom_Chr11g00993031 [Helianthus anomalus]